jgi:carboxymethylenebutenolidase
MGETVRIDAGDGAGSFGAYVAGPADAKAGVVLIQEIFGVNAGMRAMADAWGDAGYRCVCPDLFWRVEPGLELNADVETEFAKAFATYQRLDVDKAVGDIAATIAWLRAGGAAKVGAVGYCLGGLLAYLTAARTDVDAAVGYYGVTLDQRLDAAATVRNPLMLHNALLDGFVPPAAQAAVKAGLAGNPNITIHDYPADHGFARHSGAKRVPEQADLADGRTRAFFAEHLA